MRGLHSTSPPTLQLWPGKTQLEALCCPPPPSTSADIPRAGREGWFSSFLNADSPEAGKRQGLGRGVVCQPPQRLLECPWLLARVATGKLQSPPHPRSTSEWTGQCSGVALTGMHIWTSTRRRKKSPTSNWSCLTYVAHIACFTSFPPCPPPQSPCHSWLLNLRGNTHLRGSPLYPWHEVEGMCACCSYC